MQETWVQSLGQEDPLEKRMAVHSSILAWRIPESDMTERLTLSSSQRKSIVYLFESIGVIEPHYLPNIKLHVITGSRHIITIFRTYHCIGFLRWCSINFIKKKWKSFLSVHSYKHQKHVNIWVLVLLPVNESGSTWPRWVTGKAWQTPGIGGRRVLYFCAGKKMTHLIWFLLLFLADYWVPRHKGLRKHSFHPVSRPGLVTSAPLGVVAHSRYF